MIYERTKPRNKFGQQLEVQSLAAPPGTAVSQNLAELLRGVEEALGLVEIGIYTPWAGRQGDIEWKEITSPDTNVAVFQLSDKQLGQAKEVLFGQPLPFVAVLSSLMAPMLAVETAANASPYEFFETQAVYRQSDPGEPPRIQFMHWFRVRDLGASGGGSAPMTSVAATLGGELVYAQQVPVEGSTSRLPPSMSFDDALSAQLGLDVPPAAPEFPTLPGLPQPTPEVPTHKPALPKEQSLVGPILLGGAIAAATFLIGRRIK